MVAVYELLESGVRVTVDESIGGRVVGTSSYVVSYQEFKKYLQGIQNEVSGGTGKGRRDDVAVIRNNWGVGSALRLPIDCIEVGISSSGNLVVRQMIGGGGNPLFTYEGVNGKVDTSRFIVDFEVSLAKKIEKVSVSTFKGLVYGKHKQEHIVPNELLTQKMKRDFEGRTYQEIRGIETGKLLSNLKDEDVRVADNNKLHVEIERVRVEGGAINWGEITC